MSREYQLVASKLLNQLKRIQTAVEKAFQDQATEFDGRIRKVEARHKKEIRRLEIRIADLEDRIDRDPRDDS